MRAENHEAGLVGAERSLSIADVFELSGSREDGGRRCEGKGCEGQAGEAEGSRRPCVVGPVLAQHAADASEQATVEDVNDGEVTST